MCQREVRKAWTRSQRASKEVTVQPKARRLMREALVYWRKYEKVERDQRKKAEKEATEQNKLNQEMMEVRLALYYTWECHCVWMKCVKCVLKKCVRSVWGVCEECVKCVRSVWSVECAQEVCESVWGVCVFVQAKKQQRKLNFLITQTELYAHFMAKKLTGRG